MFQIMFYVGLAFTIVFFLLSLVLFVRNDVARLIGDVTGFNAKRAIRKLDRKGAEELSKTEAIHANTSKILVREEQTVGKKEVDAGKTKSILAAIQQSQGKSHQEIFQTETEMIVLAGADAATDVLEQGGSGEENAKSQQEGDATALFEADAPTDILIADNDAPTDILYDGDAATDILVNAGDMPTDILWGDDATEILYQEDETSILKADEDETGILTAQEAKEFLNSHFAPVVLADTTDSLLNMAEELDAPIFADKEEAMRLVPLTEESMPAIFEVEEDAVVVHTKERIGDLE